MTKIDLARLTDALDGLPDRYRGPGGVAGVVKDGAIVAARAWGHADTVRHLPMTRSTRLPICSISKQFTCGVLLAQCGDIDRLDARLGAFLPAFQGPLPRVRDLCHNQSGLRDYWALTVLQGALAEQSFPREQALPLLARMKTGQFAPGSRYSYSNGNFRLLAELIEAETGRALADLYRETIWGPAGMETAELTADTRHPPDEVVGHEGTPDTGFLPADNGIVWIGDAGISAALDDMLAYEAWIDATRDDPEGLYPRLSAAPSFRDGTPARYGFGLAHGSVAGRAVTGHGGALRGFRAHRLHAAAERLSVVVMFNHEANARDAATDLLKAALGHVDPAPAPMPAGWAGQWICPETGLLARLGADGTLRFATAADRLTAGPDESLQAPGLRLTHNGTGLTMRRDLDNLTTTMVPLPVVTRADGAEIAGRYRSDELGAEMVIEARDGGVYAWFEGMLGRGRMERVHPVGPDTWIVVTQRSMDAAAPGDWTLRLRRDDRGRPCGLTLGCWLARGIDYLKLA